MARKQLKKFDIIQTAKVIAILYLVVSAVFLVPFGLISLFSGGNVFGIPVNGGVMFFFLPFVYAVFAFISCALACAVYNFVASKTGGIVIEVEDD